METPDREVASPVTEHSCAKEPANEPRESVPAIAAAEEMPKPIQRWRPAKEPTCCGSGCDDCPF